MARKALGFNVTEIDPTQKLNELSDLLADMKMEYEITDVAIGKGKITIELYFDKGLEIVYADDVATLKPTKGYILASENNDRIIDSSLTDKIIKFENNYDTTTLNLSIKLAGKAGGTVGGSKAGGGVADDPYIWP